MSRVSLKSSTRLSLKLRSMPRNKNASAVYIEMHQLANLKLRLQEELQRLGDRTIQIHEQLQELELNLNQLEAEATKYNSKDKTLQSSPNLSYQIIKSPNPDYQNNNQNTTAQNTKYQNFIIEY